MIFDKLIFTIILHRHSPETFDRKWEQSFRHNISGAPSSLTQKDEDRMRNYFSASGPRIHRYNDIAGFAEVYWDGGTRILVDYYFLGDQRTKYGQAVAKRWPYMTSGNKYYMWQHMASGGSFIAGDTALKKRRALHEALDAVSAQAKQFGCYVDLTTEQEIANCIDVNKLLVRPRVKTWQSYAAIDDTIGTPIRKPKCPNYRSHIKTVMNLASLASFLLLVSARTWS
jgi:hypothetical protein